MDEFLGLDSHDTNSLNGIVLIVDDNPENLKVMASVLEVMEYEIVLASDAQQALQFCKEQVPDLILLDVAMPGIDGFELCHQLKSNVLLRQVPIVFVTARAGSDDMIHGFELGGVDYITKPFRVEELRMRVKTHLELGRAYKALRRKNLELEQMRKRLEDMARTDALTNLDNRRSILEKIDFEITRSIRHGRTFSLIICDIDHFKAFNDQHGHACGDYVLRETASTIDMSLRADDIAARWGGEEFLLLLPETHIEGALIKAEDIRAILEESSYSFEGKELGVTMTFGAAEWKSDMSIDDCIAKADRALLRGKEAGRNRVESGEEE